MTRAPYRRFVVSGLGEGQMVINIACSRVRITVSGLDTATRDALFYAPTDDEFNRRLPPPLASALTKALVGLVVGDLP